MELQKSLFKFFPPPAFLTTRSAGLAISENFIRAVLFGEDQGKPVLDCYGEVEIPAGIMEQGEIKKPKDLKEVLLQFRKKMGLDFIRASVPERKSYIVKMEIPRVPDAEIRSVVETKIEEYIPITASETIFDYQVLARTGENCDTLLLEVSAIHEKVARVYLDVFEESGFTLTSFENEAQAMARAVTEQGSSETVMIVDFDDAQTGIYVVTNGSVDFTTSIDMGGNSLHDTLKDKFSLSPEEIVEVKEKFDCNALAMNEENETTAVVMSFVSAFRDEINKRLIYWQTHKDGNMPNGEIERIILSGSESSLHGLSGYLEGCLGVPVEPSNVWRNIFDFNEYIPPISRRDSYRYAEAVGLALASERTAYRHDTRRPRTLEESLQSTVTPKQKTHEKTIQDDRAREKEGKPVPKRSKVIPVTSGE